MAYQRSQVLEALQDLLDVFKQAAGSKDQDTNTLNQEELKQLIQSQLPFLITAKFEGCFDDFFKCMECEKGSNVDFREFMCLLATIVMCQ
uniref:protein S100-G-like n=1 Tax=Pristiophorus japonicus TaxID=55135 RepID=UPI00398F03E9